MTYHEIELTEFAIEVEFVTLIIIVCAIISCIMSHTMKNKNIKRIANNIYQGLSYLAFIEQLLVFLCSVLYIYIKYFK